MSTTVIFVPGAWHGPENFEPVAKQLRNAGYQTDFVHLASVGPKEHLTSFYPDVDVIRGHVEKAVNAGQKVVMVVHSYGGIPTCEAVHGLDYKTRQANGQEGGVTHLFFCCSFIIPPGKSLSEAFNGQELPWWTISEDRMEVNPKNPAEVFYNDLPKEQADQIIATLKPHSFKTFFTQLKHASWQTIPTTYLYCLKDQAIPMFVQELMVNEFAKGYEIRTDTVDASHSPFLSKIDETVAAIQKAAELPVS